MEKPLELCKMCDAEKAETCWCPALGQYEKGWNEAVNAYHLSIEQNLVTNTVDIVINDEIARELKKNV